MTMYETLMIMISFANLFISEINVKRQKGKPPIAVGGFPLNDKYH